MQAWLQSSLKKEVLIKFLSTPQNVALVAFSLFISWLWLILATTGHYQNISGVDPLAMINLLFPGFWVILIVFAVLCFFVLRQFGNQRLLHVLLLAQLSLMFYYTPFLLGGFSWSPDSLWHGGVASYMPKILADVNSTLIHLTQYSKSYPFSFLITYGVERIFGVNIFTYTLYIFPPICIGLISTLAYFFISRIFNPKVSFLSMLLALPALHYLEPHVSPFAMGTVLVLVSLILLTYKSTKAFIFNIFFIPVIVTTHPLSPIFLGIYFFASMIVSLLFRNTASPTSEKVGSFLRFAFLFSFLVIFWFFWTLSQAAPNYPAVEFSISKVLTLGFLSNLLNGVEWTFGGEKQFIYSQITDVGLTIYGIFLSIISVIFLSNFIQFLRKRSTSIDVEVPKQLALAFTAIVSAGMGFLLFLSSGERFLLGRGLLFFLLLGSACISTYLASSVKGVRIKTAFSFGFILLLVCTFPIISYSKEAYNTFTPSSNDGLSFMGGYVDFSQMNVSMGTDQQFASYVNISRGLELVDFSDINLSKTEIIVLRINYYFVISMRYSSSFTDNNYTRLQDNLTSNSFYMKVYSNPKFDVFMRAS
ncbi:MAG: hypothetical protein QG670_2691 [Thermoproteota archaeon]|nr:hypothetical protein [Thermoproteota archaeon]